MGKYMGTAEAAEKWGRKQATVQKWCREKGKDKGTEQDGPGKPWRIPADMPNPFIKHQGGKK